MPIKDLYNAYRAKRQLKGMDKKYTKRLMRHIPLSTTGEKNYNTYNSRILGMVKAKDFAGAEKYAREEGIRLRQ